MKKLKILITGGAGYIGSHVLRLLGDTSNHEIVVVDNLETGRKESILYGRHENFDIGDSQQLEELLKKEKFDACFHFAGSIVVPESVENPIKYYKNNTVKTLSLIELCIKYNINKFIFSSTAAVYAQNKSGVYKENDLIKPGNPYGKTKYMTEWMLEDISNAYPDFNYVILRYFNVAGASLDTLIGQAGKTSTHLVKIASEVVVGKREKMFVYGNDYETKDGTCIRDYIHVLDLADAHIKGLEFLYKNNSSAVFNVGYGHGYSVYEVLDAMRSVSGHTLPVEISDRRLGDDPVLIANCDKIKMELGWTPKFNSIDIICKTASDWEANL